jgi:hypothetical protein
MCSSWSRSPRMRRRRRITEVSIGRSGVPRHGWPRWRSSVHLSDMKPAEQLIAERRADPVFRGRWDRAAYARTVANRLILYRAEHNLTQKKLEPPPDNESISDPRTGMETPRHDNDGNQARPSSPDRRSWAEWNALTRRCPGGPGGGGSPSTRWRSWPPATRRRRVRRVRCCAGRACIAATSCNGGALRRNTDGASPRLTGSGAAGVHCSVSCPPAD